MGGFLTGDCWVWGLPVKLFTGVAKDWHLEGQLRVQGLG